MASEAVSRRWRLAPPYALAANRRALSSHRVDGVRLDAVVTNRLRTPPRHLLDDSRRRLVHLIVVRVELLPLFVALIVHMGARRFR